MVRVTVVLIVCTFGVYGPLVRAAAPATIGEMVAEAEKVARNVNLGTRNAEAAAEFAVAVETLRNAGVLDQEIGTFVRRFISPDAIALAHRRQRQYTIEIKTAIDTIKGLTNTVFPSLGDDAPALTGMVSELQDAEQDAGLKWDLETLRRLERKYGPDSAKLNGLEVLAAYGLQRWSPFGVDAGGRPGPLEVVLAYAPSYISRSDEKMRLIGVAEVGLRHYIFASGWGTGAGRWAWLRPGYSSYGLAWAGGSDDPLTPPWKGSSRVGAFVGWGEIKVAWLATGDQRILVTQQLQLIPWVF